MYSYDLYYNMHLSYRQLMMVVSLKGQLIYLAVYIVVHISVSRNFRMYLVTW